MPTFQSRIFNLFGRYDKRTDTYKNGAGKGLNERFQESIGKSIDDELMGLIDQFLANTIEPQTVFDELLPLAERMLGYDVKNQTLQLGETVAWHRRILAHMIRYYHIKGTKRCYELLFEIMGLEVIIEEFWTLPTFDSSNPDLTFDSEDRPLLDLGKCTPCSRYEITIVGGPPWSEVQAGVDSIIVFNEPINAYRGLLAYNGQEIIDDDPQGDACPIPNYTITIVDTNVGAGTFEVRVLLSGTQPGLWTFGEGTYTVNNGAPIDIVGLTPGGSAIDIGPFPAGTMIDIALTNTQRPLCITYSNNHTWYPPCPVLDVDVIVEPPLVYVEVASFPAGFATDSLRYSIDGAPQIEVAFDGSSIAIGPFLEGGSLEIWINNYLNEACAFHVGPFILPAQPPDIMASFELLPDCLTLTPEYSMEWTLYPSFPGGPAFIPGMCRYRVNNGSWINYGVVVWGQVITIGPFTSGDEVDIEVANTQVPANPWLYHDYVYTCPCEITGRFPTPPIDVEWLVRPSDYAGMVAGTIPIGQKFFMHDHDSITPGTSLPELNVGRLFTRVAMGHTDADFTITDLANNELIRDLNAVGTPYEFYQVRQDTGGTSFYATDGRSGKYGEIYLFGVGLLDPGPPGPTTSWPPTSAYLEQSVPWNGWDDCRIMVVQYTENPDYNDPGAVWVDAPMPPVPPAQGFDFDPSWTPYVGAFNADFPVTATGLRAAWYRSAILQGYSRPGAATA